MTSTYSQHIVAIAEQIKHFTPNPNLDSKLILESVTGKKECELLALEKLTLNKHEKDRLKSIIYRVKSNEPLAYILGHTEFYGYKFRITPDVLIPRPETELLVDKVNHFISSKQTKQAFRVLEIGIGSGCIMASVLAKNIGKIVSYTGVEISHKAMELAKLNIAAILANLGRQNNSYTSQLDTCKYISKDIRLLTENDLDVYDIVVSNPPYISREEFENLAPSVKNYEPAEALLANNSGVEFYNTIANLAKTQTQLPYLFLEASSSTMTPAARIFNDLYSEVAIEKDQFGRDRFILCSP